LILRLYDLFVVLSLSVTVSSFTAEISALMVLPALLVNSRALTGAARMHSVARDMEILVVEFLRIVKLAMFGQEAI